jgi:tRNA modification GTPase
MSYAATDDTIIAPATAPGKGAISVIRLSGKDAITLAASAFKGKNLTEQESHTLHFGTLRDESNAVLDEVVVSIFKGPNSFTKENVVEISCHGSDFIVRKIIELFIRKGARTANPGEFTLRAFLNGRFDLSQAEAVADLIAADSEASHKAAMKQMRGGVSDEIKKLREELINFASLIELELDFSEEDVEFADRSKLEELVMRIRNYLYLLTNSFNLGNAIKTGVNTVIAGRPNAGKSTLLNALLNEERAIVSEIAGTTRDTIEESLYIKGLEFRIIDTAGIREASDTIEAIGVKKTFEKIKTSSILVYVYDAKETPTLEARADIQKLYTAGMTLVVIANKVDLVPGYNDCVLPDFMNDPVLYLSAKDKSQIEELKNTLYLAAVGQQNLEDNTIITNSRHFEALEQCNQALDRVLTGLYQKIPGDLLAQDIRLALYHLGLITGEVTTDDLLGNIFSKFCIGK